MKLCNELLEQMNEQERLRRMFPNASRSFLNRNPAFGVGLQNPQPEQSVGQSAPLEDEGKEAGPTRRAVRITSFRCRLADPDNLFCKPIIDAIKYAGLIEDDSLKHIMLEVGQKRVARRNEERTEIEIR